MPIQIECPSCNTRLQVPSKLKGKYISCPQCKGQVWVDKVSPSAPPVAERPAPAPPPAPAPRKKVARFIVAEASDSPLQPSADGRLPELQLDEGDAKGKRAAQAAPMNPWMLLSCLGTAAVLWAVLVLSLGQSEATPQSLLKDQKRQFIESEYFGSGNIEDKNLAPYQLLLREAQRAHTRGDVKTERANYRKVLHMLRAERAPDERGLTGGSQRDRKLEEAIAVLLRGD
jgi:hypothetical protein